MKQSCPKLARSEVFLTGAKVSKQQHEWLDSLGSVHRTVQTGSQGKYKEKFTSTHSIPNNHILYLCIDNVDNKLMMMMIITVLMDGFHLLVSIENILFPKKICSFFVFVIMFALRTNYEIIKLNFLKKEKLYEYV